MLALSHGRMVKKCTINPKWSKIKATVADEGKKDGAMVLSLQNPCSIKSCLIDAITNT